jgi:hypothetical protein
MHKITIAVREKDAILDRILLTTDTTDFVDLGIGGPAVNCSSSSDAPQLDIQWDIDSEDLAITFFAEDGVLYQLETSTSMEEGSWFDSGPPIEGSGESITIRRFLEDDLTFFRIAKLP